MDPSGSSEWIARFDRRHKPGVEGIRTFLPDPVFDAFLLFSRRLKQELGLGYVLPRYVSSLGWTYAYGRSGCILIERVVFRKDGFQVEDLFVRDTADVDRAVERVVERFRDGFPDRFAEFDARRKARRQARAAVQTGGGAVVVPDACVWPPKVSRQALRRLYRADAAGIPDEELLEEIGLTLYVRCRMAREIYDGMEKGLIRCVPCGAVLDGASGGIHAAVRCACGRTYIYHTYRKSFRTDNMPRGAASAVFDHYLEDWPAARTPAEKMRLIDGLIHEFHVSLTSGTRGRPVGINLIQGTRQQVMELIGELAYG